MVETVLILLVSAALAVIFRPILRTLWAFGWDALERKFSIKIDK